MEPRWYLHEGPRWDYDPKTRTVLRYLEAEHEIGPRAASALAPEREHLSWLRNPTRQETVNAAMRNVENLLTDLTP
jgi:hypothetical protein